MTELRQLNGIMNLDSPNEDFPPLQHKYLLNGRFRGTGNNMRVEPVPGTILIPNYLLPSGNNQCIGGFYDSVKRRIIWFNRNSNGRNGIYKYDINSKTLSKIFLCFTDTTTDILQFSLDYPVHSAGFVYRSEGEGDLLYWVQGNRRPSYLNIDTVASLAPFTEDMINAAKNAPLKPLVCSYGNDNTVNVNNLRKKLFRFAQRWIYKNGEKSTISTYSKVPMPVNGYNPDTDNDPNFNNRILVPVYGGGNDYQAIELLMQINNGNQWGDWQSVVILDRDDYNINPGATYNFYFYNNSIYPFIDPSDATLYFDRIPNVARAMEVLAGNHILYANITDEYDGLSREDIDVTVTAGIGGGSGIPSISFSYSGSFTIIVNIGATVTPGTQYNIFFNYVSGLGGDVTPVNETIVAGPTTTQNDIVTSFQIAIAGFHPHVSVDNLGGGVMRIRVNGTGAATISGASVSVTTSGNENAAPSWKWTCPVRLGIQYLEQWDKPVGGVYSFVSDSALDTTDFAVTTPDFSVQGSIIQVPFISASINHTPPIGAVSYHWVRAELTPKFIYWITNDYQSDTDFLYFCIQNLYYQATKNSGFVPSYDFAKGDRVRVIARHDGGGNFTTYNIQLDFEILGVEQKIMTSPASDGTFLKVLKPSTLPSTPYVTAMLIEIYTPLANTPNDLLVFKEWGEKYDIYTSGGIRYHRGQVTDQTASQPATFKWFDGDVYYKNRGFFQMVNDTDMVNAFMMDANYNDYWASAVNSNGRGWLIDEDAKEVNNEVEIRWGGAYIQDTNINELNRFRPENIDALDLAKGAILRVLSEERLLYFYHSRSVGSLGIYSRYIKNNQNEQELIATDDIITKNNIYYLKGNYGLQNQPTAVFRGTDGVHYFIDCTNGDILRRSGDGVTNLSELYYGQFFLSDIIVPYNRNYLRLDGSKSKIIGFFDYEEGHAHFLLQEGSLDTLDIPNYNFSFNEKRNGFNGFYSYHPEWVLQAAHKTYSWKDGNLYIHDDTETWNRFYGVQYYTKLTLVFNDKSAMNKVFNSVGYQSEGKVWQSSKDIVLNGQIIEEAILTSFVNPQTNFRQTSRLKNFNFDYDNGKTVAAFLRDINSKKNRTEGLWEGDFLTGFWMQIDFEYKGSDFATLYAPYVNWEVSNRNF